ncbi:Aspartic proteinase-like protein 2 [Heracleum sosnowskyi]|uniref:Aspartic proteinase-like protein 2 n=1 Tax=Heracleum sosnowskyi TaxID=360622 RepID=A0AAD8M5B8_9APIA|nr:Aspartic proteinase-like protein 2 [Heracleum sosnowskyi]
MTPVIPGMEEIKVSNLLQIDKVEWDRDLLKDIFLDTDVQRILKIPLTFFRAADTWMWLEEEKGLYTAKKRLHTRIHPMAPPNLTIISSFLLLLFAILFSRHLVYCSVSYNNNDPNSFILRRPNDGSNRHIVLLPLTLSPPPPSNFSATRRRRVQSHLPNARMRLHDDLLKNGYYTTRLMIGTPPQKFALIVDTGSSVTYVPCASCEQCGNHQDPKFQPELSTTYQPVKCKYDCTCDSESGQCTYERQYAEMSTSSGVLGNDIISFGDQSELAPQRANFGCENVETGDLYRQRADGIMGLGRGELSIVNQLVDNAVISDSFSLCYGGMDVGGGAMVLGGVSPPNDMIFIHSNTGRSTYYNVELKNFHVAGKPLSLDPGVFDRKQGTVLDSGTTYTYIPEAAFIEFKQAIMKEVSSLKQIPGPDPNYNDICFFGAGSNISELPKFFPTVDMVFENGQKLSLSPENYLFRHSKMHGGYCLGIFQNGDQSTLLGGIVVRNTFVTYDREHEKIGFWKTNCSELWERLNATGAHPPAASPAGFSTVDRPKSSAVLPPAATPVGASPLGILQVGRITFCMSLNVTYSIIKPHIEELTHNIAEELDVHVSQVKIMNFTSEGDASLIQLAILPAGSDDYISISTATSIISRLSEHSIHLHEIFGSYQVSSWAAEEPQKRTRRQKHHIAVVVTIILSLLLGLLVSATWFIWRRRQQEVAYKPVSFASSEQELQPIVS